MAGGVIFIWNYLNGVNTEEKAKKNAEIIIKKLDQEMNEVIKKEQKIIDDIQDTDIRDTNLNLPDNGIQDKNNENLLLNTFNSSETTDNPSPLTSHSFLCFTKNKGVENLQNYELLKNLKLINLNKVKYAEIKLPIENRFKILNRLEENDTISIVKLVEAPIWHVEFKTAKLKSEIMQLFEDGESVEIITKFGEDIGCYYIVELNDDELVQQEVQSFLKQFSDISELR